MWEEGLVKWGPPTYEWVFGDEPELPLEYMGIGGSESFAEFPKNLEELKGVDPRKIEYPYRTPAKWTPGFDVNRSADKTIFTSPGTQTLTITVIPRHEKIDKLGVGIHWAESANEIPVVISSTREPMPGNKPGGLGWDIPMEVDIPWSVSITIEVTPKVPKVEYMPYVAVIWNGGDWVWTPTTGTTSGNFVSYGWEEMGTWTWSADGDYVWEWWLQPPFYVMGLHPRSEVLEGD